MNFVSALWKDTDSFGGLIESARHGNEHSLAYDPLSVPKPVSSPV